MSIPVPVEVEGLPLELQEVFRYICRRVAADAPTVVEQTLNQTTGERFYDRGDPAAVDFDETDLTMDGSWYDLDLSSIIAAGASLVLLRVTCDRAIEGYLQFRENGNSNAINISQVQTIGDQRHGYGDLLVVPDGSGVVEYKASVSFNSVSIVVGGWWA